MKKPFYLHQRGGVWYYRMNRESGLVDQDDQIWHSTSLMDRKDAEDFVFNLIGGKRRTKSGIGYQSFREYAAPFFVWGEYPHIRRVLEETDCYTERHARIQRRRLVNHLFTNPYLRRSILGRRNVHCLFLIRPECNHDDKSQTGQHRCVFKNWFRSAKILAPA